MVEQLTDAQDTYKYLANIVDNKDEYLDPRIKVVLRGLNTLRSQIREVDPQDDILIGAVDRSEDLIRKLAAFIPAIDSVIVPRNNYNSIKDSLDTIKVNINKIEEELSIK